MKMKGLTRPPQKIIEERNRRDFGPCNSKLERLPFPSFGFVQISGGLVPAGGAFNRNKYQLYSSQLEANYNSKLGAKQIRNIYYPDGYDQTR